MLGLITDRTPYNVSRREALSRKGWDRMTDEEKKEWLGDPFDATGANLFSCGPYYSSVVDLKYRNEELYAQATADGTYLYAVSIIGNAADYENKVFTLSADNMSSINGTPKLSTFWHDGNGFEFAGGDLLSAGSVTFDTSQFPNTAGREYFAVYVYVTTYEPVTAGDYGRFSHVMLELGNVRHPYVPYVEILATPTTRGAYNYSDLNRVERAVAEISESKSLGLVTKTDWGAWDIPTSSDMDRFLSNIKSIRGIIPDASGVPLAPTTMNNITYVEANNIELILEAAYKSLH